MRVFEVMAKDVPTASPLMSAEDAWNAMRRGRADHLVVTRGKTVVGMLSAGDLGGPGGAVVREGKTVADLMTDSVVTVGATDTVRAVANVMRGRRIGCLPVVDRDRLVGVVTSFDLLEMLGRGIDRPLQRSRPVATHRAPHRKKTRSGAAW
jgi:acetoin utilization protein AcuB